MAFKVTHIEAPTTHTVKLVEVPVEIHDAMEAEWEWVQNNPAYQTVIGGESAAEALQNLAYAKAWGLQRAGGDESKRVIVTRYPTKAGKDSPLELRVQLTKYNPNAVARGRKPSTNGGNGVTPPANPAAETKAGKAAK